MREFRPLVGALAILLAAGCVSDDPPQRTGPGDGDSPLTPVAFIPSVIDGGRGGAEPSLAIGPDGTIYVCSPRGLGDGTHLWVSTDGGSAFRYSGTEPSAGPILRSGSGDVGGGDCDVATDEAGRAYLVDLWLGGVSVASSADHGESWRGVPVSTLAAPMDRPWVLGGAKDEVFVTAAQAQPNGVNERGANMPPAGGIWVARSTDGGLTFPQRVLAVGNENRLSLNSNLARDGGRLYLAYAKEVTEGRLAMVAATSSDRGATWMHYTIVEQDFVPEQCFSPIFIFPSVAADGRGGVYVAWALLNPETERIDLFLAASPDRGETWNEPVPVTPREGTRAFPWVAAHSSGRVGLAWYETNATVFPEPRGLADCTDETPPEAAWHVRYASSSDALSPEPVFAEVLVQAEPVHLGELGRPFAELLQVRYTPEGLAAIAYVADVAEGAARPMFALQADSP